MIVGVKIIMDNLTARDFTAVLFGLGTVVVVVMLAVDGLAVGGFSS